MAALGGIDLREQGLLIRIAGGWRDADDAQLLADGILDKLEQHPAFLFNERQKNRLRNFGARRPDGMKFAEVFAVAQAKDMLFGAEADEKVERLRWTQGVKAHRTVLFAKAAGHGPCRRGQEIVGGSLCPLRELGEDFKWFHGKRSVDIRLDDRALPTRGLEVEVFDRDGNLEGRDAFGERLFKLDFCRGDGLRGRRRRRRDGHGDGRPLRLKANLGAVKDRWLQLDGDFALAMDKRRRDEDRVGYLGRGLYQLVRSGGRGGRVDLDGDRRNSGDGSRIGWRKGNGDGRGLKLRGAGDLNVADIIICICFFDGG